MVRSRKHTAAFTLIELIVSISIFAIMTALVVVKYGSFNNSVLLTNAAYDVALAIRTAQTYGLSVRSTDGGILPTAYGIHFNRKTDSGISDCIEESTSRFVMFADIGTTPGTCDSADSIISVFNLKNGIIYKIVIGGSEQSTLNGFTVSYMRPSPEAIFNIRCTVNFQCVSGEYIAQNNYKIVLTSSDGDTRGVTIYPNGQISVDN